MADYGRLVVGVTADTSELGRQIASGATKAGDEAAKSISDRVKSGVGKAGKAIGNTLASGFALATTAVIGFGAAAVKAGADANAAQQEQALSLKALTGSTKAANTLLDALGKVNMESVFPKDVLATTEKQLIGFGWNVKQVPGLLNNLSNAAAATGDTTGKSLTSITTALGRVQTTGKFTTRQFATLGTNGVNAGKIIGAQMGITAKQVQARLASGALGGRKALQLLTKGMASTYKDAGREVTQSWTGVRALLQKQVTGIGKVIAAPFINPKGGGYFVVWGNKLRKMLAALAPVVKRIMGEFQAAFAPYAKRISGWIDGITKALQGIGKGGALNGVMGQIGKLGPAVAGLAAIFAKGGGNIARSLGPLGEIIPSSLFNPWVAGVAALVATNPAMQKAFGQVFKALQPLLGVIGKLATTLSATLAPVLTALAPIITTVGTQVIAVLIPPLQAMIPIVTALAPLLTLVAQVLGAILSNKVVVDVVIALAAAWYVLDAALAANPFGLIVAAIAAVAVGLVMLWQHSKTFRTVVLDSFHAVQAAGQAMWHALQTAVGAIKTALVAAYDWVRGHWKLLAAILGGPFVAAVVLIVSNWKRIKSAVSAGINAVASVARAVGNAVRAALVAPFTAAVSRISTIVGGIKGKITGAFSGAVGWLKQAGVDLIQGFVNGIGSMAKVVENALLALLPGPLKKFAGKLGLASPSKLFHQYGVWVVQGFVNGITATTAKAASAARKLASDFVYQMAKGLRGTASQQTAAVQKFIDTAHKNLSGPARVAALSTGHKWLVTLTADQKLLAKATSNTAAAQGKYNDALKAQSSYAAGVSSAIKDYNSITANPTTNVSDLISDLQSRLSWTKTFAANVKALAKAGLNKASLRQIMDAGVDQGSAVAQALASGGAAAIRQVNSLQSQVSKSASSLGKFGGTEFYQAGVNAAKGLLSGMQSQQKVVESYITNLAKRITKTLKKAFKIGSPSQVFADEVGSPLSAGIILGLDNMQGALDARVLALVGRPNVPSLSGAIPASAARTVRGQAASGATVNVYPRESQSEQAIAAATSRELGWMARTA